MSGCVCVTGANGSIGAALVRRFVALGIPVRALVRSPDRRTALKGLDIEFAYGDLARPETLRGALDGCATVYHTAAKLTGADLQAYAAINVGGTEALVAEARRAGAERFVHVSSIAIYGYPDARDVAEDYPWERTTDPYAATKQGAERAVWAASKQLPVAVARPGDVVGPGQGVWTVMLTQQARRRLLQPVRGAGVLNPVYIDNLLDGLLLVGEHPGAVGQAFNLVDGVPLPMNDYIRYLVRLTHRRPVTLPRAVVTRIAWLMEATARRCGAAPPVTRASVDFLFHRTTFSNARAQTVLGWRPRVSWDDGMRRTEAWLQAQGLIPAS
ncbi:MAG: NAD-dependent epimerase/dehydratase family protein [Anaerolineae bacterium]